MHPTNRRSDGAEHEALALRYLLERGYRLVKQNFRFGRSGEIDLVMADGDVFVFVEVKCRRTHSHGTPEDAVTPAKRRRIRRIAEGFFYVMQIPAYEARFDMIAIDYVTGTSDHPEIRHHINAF